MYFVYNTEFLGDENQYDFFQFDERLFDNCNNKQVSILGIIGNTNKDFRLDDTFNRDSASLKKFISKNGKKEILLIQIHVE